MQGKITECWLAETGHFFLNQEGMITWCRLAEHACIKLVSRFKRILKRNLISTRSFHLNVKENQHATKRSLLVEKQKDFSDQKRIDSQPENSLSGDGSQLVSNEALDRTSCSPLNLSLSQQENTQTLGAARFKPSARFIQVRTKRYMPYHRNVIYNPSNIQL